MKIYLGLLVALLALTSAAVSHATSFTYAPIVGNVSYGVAVDGDNVAFVANDGIYISTGGAATPVATRSMILPGESASLGAGTFGVPWIDGQSVTFVAQRDFSAGGIYVKPAGGSIGLVANSSTTRPGTPLNFTNVGRPTTSNGAVLFVGNNTTFGESGIYRAEAGQIDVVVNNHTLVPGSTTQTFNSFNGQEPIHYGNSTVFHANSSSSVGVFRETGGVIQEVVATRLGGPSAQTPISNQPNGAYLTSVQLFSADSGDVAFYGGSSTAARLRSSLRQMAL